MDKQTSIYWQRTKIVLKFVWRHFLTIPIASLLILAIIGGKEDLIYHWGFFTVFAMIFDHGKCNRSSWGAPGRGSSFDDRPLTTQQWWNSSMMGTPAYHIDQMGK